MTESVTPEPTPEQAAMIARVRRLMLIAGLTTAIGVGAVLIAVGYRLFHVEGSTPAGASAAMLPRGAKIVSTATTADRIVVTVDIGGVTEIHTYDARSLKPAGTLKFVTAP
jgi:hypothetical protein